MTLDKPPGSNDQTPPANSIGDVAVATVPASVVSRWHGGKCLAAGLLLVMAVVCMTHLGYQQIQTFKKMREDLPWLNDYRQAMDDISAWAQQTGTHEISYLQTAPSSYAAGAKESMTRYLLAPLILRPPTKAPLLINLNSEAEQKALEKSQKCHPIIQFAPGVAVMERNQ